MQYLRVSCVFYLSMGVQFSFDMRVLSARLIDVLDIPETTMTSIENGEAPKGLYKEDSGDVKLDVIAPINKNITSLSIPPANRQRSALPIVEMRGFSASWDAKQPSNKAPRTLENAALKNLSLKFERGKLYGVVGKIGSGKSSLLNAILQEMPLFSGSIEVNTNKMAYVEQEP